MERALASIQRITKLDSIEGADFIERALILGWQTVVKIGEFKEGDLCVYFEIDSILPERPEYEFMSDRKMRVRSMRFKGQIAQGLALPLKTVGLNVSYCREGDDVTKQLRVKKYEPFVASATKLGSAKVKGILPFFIKKSDEFRVQSYPKLIDEMRGMRVYQSVKLDGTSLTLFYNKNIDNPFGVCSRNLQVDDDGQTAYWRVANRYNMAERMTKLDKSLYLQLELCGPGIQKNPMNLPDIDMYAFNLFFLEGYRYGNKDELEEVCSTLGIKTVPIEDEYVFDHSLKELLVMAEGYYEGTTNHREGIVIRPCKSSLTPTLGYSLLSYKVINNEFLLKNKQ